MSLCVPFTDYFMKFHFILMVVTVIGIFMTILFILYYIPRLSVNISSGSANAHLPNVYATEYWIEHVNFGHLYVMFRLSTTISYREVPGFQLIVLVVLGAAYLMYIGPLFRNLVWNDSRFVSSTQWRTTFLLFGIMFYIYLSASQHDYTLFSFTFFSCLK